MAPKKKYTKEEMVMAAVEVVRKKGEHALSARSIAQELGVSTQPVFTCFGSMDAVKRDVRVEADKVYRAYVSEGLKADIPFFGFGQSYIKFAKQEPNLYRLLFLTPTQDGENGALATMEESKPIIIPSLIKIYAMSEKEAERYFRDVWLATHSLATLIVTGGFDCSNEEIGKILTGFSLSICTSIKTVPGFVDNNFDKNDLFTKIIN